MKKTLGLVIVICLSVIQLHANSDNNTFHTFTSGETISSSQMNNNFLLMKKIIDNLTSQVDTLTSQNVDMKKDGIALFNTSKTYGSSAPELQSRNAANSECKLEVEKLLIASENIKSCSNVVALLSINENDKISDFDFLPNKRIYSIDGQLIMNNFSNLLQNNLERYLEIFYGFSGGTGVWTGYGWADDGSANRTCNGWTEYSRDYRFSAGQENQNGWLINKEGWCNDGWSHNIYCLCY